MPIVDFTMYQETILRVRCEAHVPQEVVDKGEDAIKDFLYDTQYTINETLSNNLSENFLDGEIEDLKVEA